MTSVRKRVPIIIDAELDQIEIRIGHGQIVFRELISLPVDYRGEVLLNFDADQHLLSIHLIGARDLLPRGMLVERRKSGTEHHAD